MFEFWRSLPKSKRPMCKNYADVEHAINSFITETLSYRNQSIDLQSKSMDWFLYDSGLRQERVKDNIILAKLHFFPTVANVLNPLLTCHQTTNSMIPLLYDDLCSLLREIISWFINPTILQKVDRGLVLCKFDLNNRENILSCNKINIDRGATKVINNKIRTDTATPREISMLKEECVTFLSTVLAKIIARSPLKYSLIRYASSLSPTNMTSKPDIVANRLKSSCYSLNNVKNVCKKVT